MTELPLDNLDRVQTMQRLIPFDPGLASTRANEEVASRGDPTTKTIFDPDNDMSGGETQTNPGLAERSTQEQQNEAVAAVTPDEERQDTSRARVAQSAGASTVGEIIDTSDGQDHSAANDCPDMSDPTSTGVIGQSEDLVAAEAKDPRDVDPDDEAPHTEDTPIIVHEDSEAAPAELAAESGAAPPDRIDDGYGGNDHGGEGPGDGNDGEAEQPPDNEPDDAN